mmetsp:Transcript_7014/g.11412  ORF Transcript_7014/g.11412 Transcript_7014/m.11412 type:complete len:80 (-) Transcript_7014:3-242(-)
MAAVAAASSGFTSGTDGVPTPISRIIFFRLGGDIANVATHLEIAPAKLDPPPLYFSWFIVSIDCLHDSNALAIVTFVPK